MSNKSLAVQLQESKKINEILVKRDKALRERFAYMLWLQFTGEFNCNEAKIIKELDRLDSVYESEQKMKINVPDVKIIYQNRNWFVNKHLDNFLSRFN